MLLLRTTKLAWKLTIGPHHVSEEACLALLTGGQLPRIGQCRVARGSRIWLATPRCSLVRGAGSSFHVRRAEVEFIQSEFERLSGIYQRTSLNPRCITRTTTTNIAIRPTRRFAVNCQRVLSGNSTVMVAAQPDSSSKTAATMARTRRKDGASVTSVCLAVETLSTLPVLLLRVRVLITSSTIVAAMTYHCRPDQP